MRQGFRHLETDGAEPWKALLRWRPRFPKLDLVAAGASEVWPCLEPICIVRLTGQGRTIHGSCPSEGSAFPTKNELISDKGCQTITSPFMLYKQVSGEWRKYQAPEAG